MLSEPLSCAWQVWGEVAFAVEDDVRRTLKWQVASEIPGVAHRSVALNAGSCGLRCGEAGLAASG